jgi:hypothetical protein
MRGVFGETLFDRVLFTRQMNVSEHSSHKQLDIGAYNYCGMMSLCRREGSS